MKKRALSIIAVLALLIAALTVTAMAAETPIEPNNASAYANTEMKGKFGPEYPVTQYCPVCNAEKKWYPLDKGMTGTGVIDYNHYYLLANITHTGSGFYRIPSGKTVCMYMNGYNISSEAYIAVQVSGGTFNLIGNGTETVSGGGLNSPVYGAAFDIRGGTLNLYGVNVTKTPGTTRSGPTIGMNEAAGTLNVYNGTTISGGTNSGNGGNIGLYYEGCAVNIYGGTVSNGTATHGGNIYASGANYTVNISGGTVTGGEATTGNGGNINVCGKSAVNITGGTLSGGIAGNEGGNLYSDSYTQIKVSGGTVTGGKAKNGGSFSVSNSYFTFTGGSISGGEATNMGGNLYFAVYATQYAGITINNKDGGDAPSLSNGIANGAGEGGGNIRVTVASGKTLTIEDLTATGGKGVYGGNITITGDGNVVLNNVTTNNGKATYAPNIYTSAKGSVQMTNVSAIGGTGKDGGNASTGGSIYISNTTGATLTNCTFGNATTGTAAANGGTMYIGAPTTLNGCTVTKGTATSKGGNIYAGAALTINGSEISNGTSTGGGNIHMVSATLTIDKYGNTKSTISGGYSGAGQGGNISCGGDTVIKNATISGGTTTTAWGGNIYIDSAKITIGEGATIQNGTASGGGNLNAYAATVDIDDATFIGGTANNSGTYAGGGSIRLWKCTTTIDNTTITGGTAGSYVGGNLYGYGSDSITLEGCTIGGGTAGTGANVYVGSAMSFTDCVFELAENATGTGNQVYAGAQTNLDGCTFNGGTVYADANVVAKDTAINGLTIRQGTLTLKGATDITSATFGQYPENTDSPSFYGGLLVDSTYTGTTIVSKMLNGTATYGGKLASSYTANGDFTGKVIMNAMDAKPWLFHDSGALVVGNARTQKGSEITWHKNNATAAQNYGEADLLIPGNHELPLAGGNYVVNVAGIKNLNVTGTGSVTFFDTANKNFKDYGSVVVADTVTVANDFATQIAADGDNTYFMLETDGALTFHRLDMKVDGVSIRPSTAGIYYTSVWHCDDLLKEKILSFGVAVSLDDQPAEDFVRDSKNLYTAFDKYDFENGKTVTSVLINHILETDNAQNATRGEMPIFATAYITVDDGNEGGYTVVDAGAVNYSLKQVMELIDSNPKVYVSNKQTVDNFYTKWQSVMGAWDLQNITGTLADPAEDDTYNVLMIGNSYCYYYVQELYDLMAQDGIKANVYNLYKSGCTLEEHYNWWVNDHNGYQFFWKTNEDGYNLVNADKTYVTMADSLLAENWDVISIQESLFKNIQSVDQGSYVAQARVYMDTLIPMLQKAFPNAEIYWHQQFGPEAGFQLGQISVPDADAQANYVAKEAYLANFAKETYGVKIVNTGDAWAAARANEELVAMLPTGGLCARIGENNFAGTDGGDGYHDGDIGGGQFLNACVWYETLTGGDCTAKAFRSDKLGYALSPELVAALQETAHATVNK